MKYKLIFAFAFVFLLLPFVFGEETTNSHGLSLTLDGAEANIYGVWITANESVKLTTIGVHPSSTISKCYFGETPSTPDATEWSSINWTSNATITASKNGSFDEQPLLENDKYYVIVCDKEGASYSRYSAAQALPLNGTTISWYWRAYGSNYTSISGAGGRNNIYNIMNITTESGDTDFRVNATLLKPENGASLTINTTNLTIKGGGANYTLANATFWVWNSTGGVWNKTTNSTFNSTNGTEIGLHNIPIGDYTWNSYICGNNATVYNCNWSITGNRTFSYAGFSTDEELWENFTNEGDLERFLINVTFDGSLRLSTVDLVYNGTSYSGTFTSLGAGSYKITKQLVIPDVQVTLNQSFYWSFLLDNGFTTNSTEHNQTVRVLGADDCSVYTYQAFNFSMFDEGNELFLKAGNKTSMKISLNFQSLTGGRNFLNYSHYYNDVNPAKVCLQNPLNESQYRLDGVIEYSSLDRFIEFYHIQNYTLSNDSNNATFSLFNLNDSQGTEFKIVYKDANFVPISGAILQIQRKYLDSGVFKTIERPKTGTEGYTIGHLVRNDAIYNIIVLKEGKILATFTDVVADCQNPALFSCQINLNTFGSSNFPQDFRNADDLSFTLTFNSTTRIVTSIFTIPSGVPDTILLNVTLFDRLGNTSVCSNSLFSSGGQLACTVPGSFGNATIVAKIFKGGDFIGQAIIKIKQSPIDIWGSNVILIAMLFFLVIIGIGASSDSPMLFGIMLALGSIVLVSLNLIYTPSIVGVGATILWFIIAIVLILIKGSGRS